MSNVNYLKAFRAIHERNFGAGLKQMMEFPEIWETLHLTNPTVLKTADGECFSVTINGRQYCYQSEALSASDLLDKFNAIGRHSQGMALTWVKKNSKSVPVPEKIEAPKGEPVTEEDSDATNCPSCGDPILAADSIGDVCPSCGAKLAGDIPEEAEGGTQPEDVLTKEPKKDYIPKRPMKVLKKTTEAEGDLEDEIADYEFEEPSEEPTEEPGLEDEIADYEEPSEEPTDSVEEPPAEYSDPLADWADYLQSDGVKAHIDDDLVLCVNVPSTAGDSTDIPSEGSIADLDQAVGGLEWALMVIDGVDMWAAHVAIEDFMDLESDEEQFDDPAEMEEPPIEEPVEEPVAEEPPAEEPSEEAAEEEEE